MIKTSRAALVLAVALTVSVPNALYAGTPSRDLRSGPGDDTVISRLVKTIKRAVRTILEQPAIPIPDVPTTH
jgi:hypothetical protein